MNIFKENSLNNDENKNNNKNINSTKNAQNINQNINNHISYSGERRKNRLGSKTEMIKPLTDVKKMPKIVKTKNKSKKILFYFLNALLFSLIIIIIIYLIIKYKRINNEKEIIEHKIKVEKVMKVFKPTFKINSKKNMLNQILFKSIKKYITLSDGIETSYSTFTKAKYDVYILNESLPEKDKIFII